MSSHRNLLLRLIPKAVKDVRELKYGRPIMLSTYDHKLITQASNIRILNTIKDHVMPAETAYLKGRNIAENLHLINALAQSMTYNADVNATLIALDAQKAFDSVTNDYLSKVLENIGLNYLYLYLNCYILIWKMTI
jgi:hypothetical protein